MKIGDLVVRSPEHWANGLDELGIVVGYSDHNKESVLVEWIQLNYRRHHSIKDLELYHENR